MDTATAPIQADALEVGDLLLCGARFREVLAVEPRAEDLETAKPTEFYVTVGGKDRARRLTLTADLTLTIRDRAVIDGRQVKARDLKEGTEILGVGVMEADAEPLGSTHVRLYVADRIFDKPADELVSVGD